ncbi:MAG: septal ring lytic transglycosylase RlpA family lipoprotein, partial [Bradyrhizobiaceae bacterium]
MLSLKTLGSVTRPRTAIAFVAATLLIGGTATEASAKSRHHRHHHRHQAQADTNPTSDWRNANASMNPTSGSGRSFSGMASYYGNESGSRTASGQRFNQNALT